MARLVPVSVASAQARRIDHEFLSMSTPEKRRRLCVFLLQLGGPESVAEIEPFLRNLFEDVLPVPRPMRRALGNFMAKRRAPSVAPLYERIGGASPLRANTEAQARALEERLAVLGLEAKVFVAMRYAPPRVDDALEEARRHWSDATWVALPLYPQYSFATTRSSLDELMGLLTTPEQERLYTINAYPADENYLAALTECVQETLAAVPSPLRHDTEILCSAHGLPLKLVREGDPYPDHVRQTMDGLQARLPQGVAFHLSYQSRVGPVRWLTPATEETVRRLGRLGVKSLVVVPVSFISEHIETLYELDIQLREVAAHAGIVHFARAPTPSVRPTFIAALGDLVLRALPRLTASAA